VEIELDCLGEDRRPARTRQPQGRRACGLGADREGDKGYQVQCGRAHVLGRVLLLKVLHHRVAPDSLAADGALDRPVSARRGDAALGGGAQRVRHVAQQLALVLRLGPRRGTGETVWAAKHGKRVEHDLADGGVHAAQAARVVGAAVS